MNLHVNFVFRYNVSGNRQNAFPTKGIKSWKMCGKCMRTFLFNKIKIWVQNSIFAITFRSTIYHQSFYIVVLFSILFNLKIWKLFHYSIVLCYYILPNRPVNCVYWDRMSMAIFRTQILIERLKFLNVILLEN